MAKYSGPRPALGSVGQYQMSAVPFVTGNFTIPAVSTNTPIEISFPTVSQWVYLQNNGSTGIRVGFSAIGTSGSADGAIPNNYFFIPPTDSAYQLPILRWRVRSLFFLSSAAADNDVIVVAGLTGIDNDLITEEGPNYSGSVGIG